MTQLADSTEDIDDKINLCLECGVKLIWIVHPVFKTITVYRPGDNVRTFNLSEDISADPHLPGFVVKVSDLFGPPLAPRK